MEASMLQCSHLPAVFALSGAFAFVLGCSEPAGLANDPVRSSSSTPSLRTEQNPEGSGAVVIHAEQGAFFTTGDGLAMLIGWTFDELEEFCTTGDITIGSLRELSVFRPDGSLKYGLHGTQIPLLVWQTNDTDLCGLLNVPHLTGTGQMFASDNDFNVSGNRTESTVGKVHGKVTSEEGDRFRFTNTFHAVILRTGELQKFVLHLELTPIGK
jgi:hypothetical protein